MSNAQAEQFKNQGNDALNRNDFPEAIRLYTKAIELEPKNHIYYSNRAAAYTSSMLLDQAVADAKKAIELQPNWSRGYSRLGAAYARQGDVMEAKKAYEDGLRHCPGDSSLMSGIQHLQTMMQQQQQQLFASLLGGNLKERIQNDPRIAPMMQQAEFVQMIDDISANPAAISKYQQNPMMSVVLEAAISSMRGSFGESPFASTPSSSSSSSTPTPSNSSSSSSSSPSSASSSTPSSSSSSSSSSSKPSSSMDVQEEAPDLEDIDESEEERQAKENKKKAVQFKEQGNTLYKALKFDEAIDAYNQAIALDPTEMSFLTNRAAVHFQAERYDQCIADCEEAIRVGREHRASFSLIARAFLRIGNAHYKLGRLDEALEAFRKSQSEERSRETAKLINKVEQEKKRHDEQAYINPELALAAKERGNALFKEGKFPQALAEYEEAVKRNPKEAVYYSNRAAAYHKLWEFQKAIEDCDKAIELDPTFIRAYVRKGQVLAIRKEYSKAMDVYRAGLAHDPENAELKSGLQRVVMTINQEQMTGQVDPERVKRAMADPEIQAILKDAEISVVLQQAQTDPTALQRAMKDPKLREKIEKLIASGII